VMRLTLDASAPLSAVAAIVAEGRAEGEGGFVLRVPFPRREYASAEELQTSLRAARLVPRGTLLVLNESERGMVRQGVARRRAADVTQLMAQMAEMQPADAMGVGASYEELLELGETMGEASVGLTRAELSQLQVRQLDEQPEDEQRCSICCCEFVQGDRLLSLQCGHDYHPECIGTWLRSKRNCPMCKREVL